MASPPDTGLPVESALPAIREALAGPTRAAVVTAPPGAGKTTVIPLRLLDEPWLAGRRIVMLQPRRLAARAAASRIAHLAGELVGGLVGFQTRDERCVSDATRIHIVTEGVLTRWLQTDRFLPDAGLVVFDEFHERSVQADLALALLLDVRRGLRDDIRVMVMSATLDATSISRHLDAPVVAAVGREFPIDIVWVPRQRKTRLDDAVSAAVLRALRDHHGDLLVFLPGAAEIRGVERQLRSHGVDANADIRPLYGALPIAAQDQALAPSATGERRIVLATDIAETSLTVPGIRVVVDAGLARVPRHDSRTGITRLTTVSASKASAEQRSGRAGRVEPGVAYRLWSKIEHAARPPHLPPEISQVDMTGVALELALWTRAPRPEQTMPFVDAPPPRALAEARALLVALGALDAEGGITDLGARAAALPVHPRLATMIIRADAPSDRALACAAAAVVEERDVLRGRGGEAPVDIRIRIALILDSAAHHELADGRAVAMVRERAADIAARAGTSLAGSVADDVLAPGRLLALAYPDRIATNRSTSVRGITPGRFRLVDGSPGWVTASDALAACPRLVAIDLDGRKDPRIRLAAPLA